MKKLFLASAIALFGLSNAQINKGTIYVSGQVNYKNNKTTIDDFQEKRTGNTFKISPSVGVFVASNLAVGASVGYLHSKVTSQTVTNTSNAMYAGSSDISVKSNLFEIAPFVRKYFTVSDKLYFFGHLEVPIAFGKVNRHYVVVTEYPSITTVEEFQFENKSTSIGVNVKPGLDYFLNKNLTIEATFGEFGYNNSKEKGVDGSVENYNFGVNLSSVTFGVKYVFAK